MAAGLAAFEQLTADVYTRLESLGAKLEMGLMKAAHDHTRSVQVQRVGSMISLFFSNKPVVDFESAEQSDTRAFAAFFHAMLEAGILLPPSPQESWFLSAAHDEWQIGAIIDAAHDAFGRL
jgi:glutamate-1-semialdehyde 2,1-aminomutase